MKTVNALPKEFGGDATIVRVLADGRGRIQPVKTDDGTFVLICQHAEDLACFEEECCAVPGDHSFALMLQPQLERYLIATVDRIDGMEICFESEDGSPGWLQFRTALFMGES